MNIFANKKIWKKMIFALGIIVFIGLMLPKQVNAGIGGTLITPVVDLFTGLADGVQTLIHKIFNHQDTVLYLITDGISLWKIVIGAIVGLVLVATGVITLQFLVVAGVIVLTLTLTVNGFGDVFFPTVKTITTSMLADKSIVLPAFTLTPYEIFTSEEGVFSVNFFKEDEKSDSEKKNSTSNNEEKDEEEEEKLSLNQNIRDWYKTLRLIAIVGMMSVLVYMGIRILLSSTAESKAKYKQMLWDWLVATFLIFTMQYIMVFANIMVDTFTDALGTIKIETEIENKDTKEKIKKHVNKEGVEGYVLGAKLNGKSLEIDTDTSDLVKKAYKQLKSDDDSQFKFYADTALQVPAKDEGSANILFWPADNFATQARMNLQLIKNIDGNDTTEYIGYSLVYVALTIYTVIFIFVYIKRYVYMVFLTLVSPLVALTYPIDKVKDGQAQAFNFWFKEYMYNLLLQPLHLILYMLLIGSAMRFAASDPLYVIVCLGFMVPAEKLLKAMFGFKGQTPGSMPGVATAALMMEGTRRLLGGKPPKGGMGSSSSSNKESGDEKSAQKIRSADTYNSVLYDGQQNQLNNQDENTANSPQMRDNEINNENNNSENNSPSNEVRQDGGNARGIDYTLENNETQDNSNTTENGNNGENSSRNTNNKFRVKDAVGSVGKAFGSTMKNRITDKERWKNTGKRALRMATGIPLGAVGVAAGGLAGMVSGDPSKAFQNMTTLGAAGYLAGSRAGESIVTGAATGISNFASSVTEEYYAGHQEDRERREMKKSIKEFKNDRKKMGELRNKIDNEKMYNDLIKEDGKGRSGIDEYKEFGVDDAKDMAALEHFRANYNGMTREQAITVWQMNKDVTGGKRFDKLSKKNQDEWRDTMAQNFRKSMKTSGMTEEQINTYVANNVRKAEDYITQFGKERAKMD